MKTCAHTDCDRPMHARGLCKKHYTPPSSCAVDDCDRHVHGRGYCDKHLRALKLYGDPLGARRYIRHDEGCTFPGCRGEHHAYGLCKIHYARGFRMRQIDANPMSHVPAGPVRELLELKVGQGWTYGELAMQIGVSRRTIDRILGDQRLVRATVVDQILTAFGHHPDEFFPAEIAVNW